MSIKKHFPKIIHLTGPFKGWSLHQYRPRVDGKGMKSIFRGADDLTKGFIVEGFTPSNIDKRLGRMRLTVVYTVVSPRVEIAGFLYLRRWPGEMPDDVMEIAYALSAWYRGFGLIQQILADLLDQTVGKVRPVRGVVLKVLRAFIELENLGSIRLLTKYQHEDGSPLVPCIGTDEDKGHKFKLYNIDTQLVPTLRADANQKGGFRQTRSCTKASPVPLKEDEY